LAKDEFVAWGEKYHPDIKYSSSWGCPCGKWGWFTGFIKDNPYGHVVGFSPEQPFPTHHEEGSAGIIILECPRCFKKFWFHITLEHARYCMKLCPQWPKSAD